MSELDERFTFDETGTINGVKIKVYNVITPSVSLMDELRDYLADKVDDFFAKKENEEND